MDDVTIQLRTHLAELEIQLEFLRNVHGHRVYEAMDPYGHLIASPILVALVEGYSALAKLQNVDPTENV